MQTTIVLQGTLSEKWVSCFEGLQISYYGETTIMHGKVTDNSALHGLLSQIRNLNLNIISIHNTYNK